MTRCSPTISARVDPAASAAAAGKGAFRDRQFRRRPSRPSRRPARTRSLARSAASPSAVLTFEPHPADYFAGRPVVFRLTPFAERRARCRRSVSTAWRRLTFDAALASLTAEEFVEEFSSSALDIGAAVVGADFHFGKGRSGSPAFLHARARASASMSRCWRRSRRREEARIVPRPRSAARSNRAGSRPPREAWGGPMRRQRRRITGRSSDARSACRPPIWRWSRPIGSPSASTPCGPCRWPLA